jgi:putative membrane protein
MWGDIIKNSRLLSRLIWIHLPARIVSGRDATVDEIKLSISEKKAALGLIEGFAVAVKHHLRGEMGIYHADLYPLLVRHFPLLL